MVATSPALCKGEQLRRRAGGREGGGIYLDNRAAVDKGAVSGAQVQDLPDASVHVVAERRVLPRNALMLQYHVCGCPPAPPPPSPLCPSISHTLRFLETIAPRTDVRACASGTALPLRRSIAQLYHLSPSKWGGGGPAPTLLSCYQRVGRPPASTDSRPQLALLTPHANVLPCPTAPFKKI